MGAVKKYKVYRNKELIGEYTAAAAAAMIKCTAGTVRTYASGGKALYGEYTFEVIEPEMRRKSHGLQVMSGLQRGRRRDREFYAVGWI